MPKKEDNLQKLLRVTWLEQQDIVNQVTSEFDRGDAAMVNVKRELDSDYKLYRSQKRVSAKERIGDWTVFSTHSALMARSYITRPESSFSSSDIGDDMGVKNLNNALIKDFSDDDMEIVKYRRDFYKYLMWAGITARWGWDGKDKKSTFQNVDPRNGNFDPDGDYPTGRYAFFGFDRHVYKEELHDWGLWNEDLMIQDRNTTRIQDPKITDQQQANINTQYYNEDDTRYNPLYKIHYHETTFRWKKWSQMAIIITGNSNSLILWVILVETTVFAFSYWRPDGTPLGMRVTSITGNVQRIKAEFANLRLDKSKAELYPMYIRNKRIIPNSTDLEFGFNKIIDANPLEGESIKDAMVPMQKDFRSDFSFEIDASLDGIVQSTTSIGKIQKWSSPERREWVGTNKLIQESTDVNLALDAKIEAWWEKQLLKLFINGLRENLTKWDKKTVNTITAYWVIPRALSRKDFALWEHIEIIIITKIEKDEKDNKLRLAYWTAIWLIQNLSLTESAKRFLYRDYFEVIWLDTEKAERIIDYTPDEIEAIMNVWLLDMWEIVAVKESYDPMTHLAAIKAVKKPWENVDAYKYGLMQLYRIKWIKDQQVQENESVANNMSAQAMSNVANETQQSLQEA